MAGYGGILICEIDAEHGNFYVKRDAGYWNMYKILAETPFLNWIKSYSGDIEINNLHEETEEQKDDVPRQEQEYTGYTGFDDWNDDGNYGSWGNY